MPRIKNTQFTQDELKILRIVVGSVGGDSTLSYRKHIDTLYEKLKIMVPYSEELLFILNKLDFSCKTVDFPIFKNGFYEEDKC